MASLPFRTKNNYDLLVSAFEDAAGEANCGLLQATRPLSAKFLPAPDDCNTFEAYIHLYEWNVRSTSGKERVHILLHVQETIECATRRLTHSTVRVGYFQVQDNRAILLHSVHFDHGPTQDAHPMFHAQLTSETFNLPKTVAQELEFAYEQVPCNGCFKNARIPTSDMTLPSVLLCLAADHIQFRVFCDFYEKVQSIQAELPQPIYETTRASIEASPGHLRSSHWFAHTPRSLPEN